jgi:hypothetical protein
VCFIGLDSHALRRKSIFHCLFLGEPESATITKKLLLLTENFHNNYKQKAKTFHLTTNSLSAFDDDKVSGEGKVAAGWEKVQSSVDENQIRSDD